MEKLKTWKHLKCLLNFEKLRKLDKKLKENEKKIEKLKKYDGTGVI